MRNANSIIQKISTLEKIQLQVNRWKLLGKKIVFTNGVFDILHEGHIASLSSAASFGDVLIVGVNADSSVKRLKGDSRPINNQDARALLLASLVITDAVIIFEEDTPLNLIQHIMPDVLVKGGDYTIEQIVGAKEVTANGGEVKIVPLVEGISTTAIIQKIATS
ncbi:D-glycero-beta-D-manno-heptose 1-phosphate adenylyltransferase [Ferruginibacter sp. SUN002]|uniref:D-glycero-beta-D-manno-heptose 1-phosphate adenylyltransferase n=1 Tax=Ferruginibacter sp. SUN002 TaxID=2937789 RepID=UPI003D367E72